MRDPRLGRDEEPDVRELSECEPRVTTPPAEGAKKDDPADRPHLVMLTKWVFTAGDPDCYPSVPHEHFQKKTNSWPKLNPYTGRVFSAPHEEDKARRLTKEEMQILWIVEIFGTIATSRSTGIPSSPHPVRIFHRKVWKAAKAAKAAKAQPPTLEASPVTNGRRPRNTKARASGPLFKNSTLMEHNLHQGSSSKNGESVVVNRNTESARTRILLHRHVCCQEEQLDRNIGRRVLSLITCHLRGALG
jgi:hypothetical protein